MEAHEAEAVVEVIEELIAEVGLDAVPDEVDVEGALTLLIEEIENGRKEEGTNSTVGMPEEEVVAVDAAESLA